MYRVIAALAAVFTAAIVLAGLTGHAGTQSINTEQYSLRVVTVAKGLDEPWSLAWLPDGRMLVTEKPGRMRIVAKDGRLSKPVKGVPKVVDTGQGGLLDVILDPEFATNKKIYFSYSEPGSGGQGTAVASATLDGLKLTDTKVLFRQSPKSGGGRHYGGRLVIARDGTLFITVGDRGQRDKVQNKKINRGQVIRIHTDGSIPDDNPFVGKKGFRPETWSHGHRNPQGAALHPETGKLWVHEHGPAGGDEVNVVEAGRNYGWPVIGYGKHYSGAKVGVGTKKPGMEQPVHYWDPSIAPSGMAFYTGDKFPKWKGNLLVGALGHQTVVRLVLDGEKVVGQERILDDLGERIRDVRMGPDGYVYLLTDDNDGRILRLEPSRSSS